MDRRLSAGGDSGRTPMAWRHRDQLYSQQQGYHNGDIYSTAHAAHSQHGAHGGRSTRSSSGGRGGPLPSHGGPTSRPPRTASPPETTSNSSSLSSESQAPPHHHAMSGHHGMAGMSAAASASLSTWDGELGEHCLQGLHYAMAPGLAPGSPPPPGMLMLPPGYAMHGMPPAVMLAPPMGPMGPPPSMGPPMAMAMPVGPPMGPPPAILLPPMMRPRPLVFPAAPTTPTPPEPLPVREPKAVLALPPKELMAPRHKVKCCRGGCIVLWIIVGLILMGALLATALRFVFP